MKRVLIALLVCFSGIATAQTADGTIWRVLPANAKLFYVIGYREGNCTGAAQALTDFQPPNNIKGKDIAGCSFPVGITNYKIVARVDRFYANPRNRLIITSIALMVVKSELEGTPVTDAMLESFRKLKTSKAAP